VRGGGEVKQKIIVRDEPLRNRAVAVCGTIPLSEVHEVIIRPYKVDRSAAQNAYYWRILTIIGADLGLTKEEAHETFKERFLVPIFCRDDQGYADMYRAVVEARNGLAKEVVKLTSTTKCNVAQMTEYLNDIKHEAANLGIRLPMEDR
jgi:hypothetical protein